MTAALAIVRHFAAAPRTAGERLRLAAGLVVAALGLVALGAHLAALLADAFRANAAVGPALLAASINAAATGIGALPVLFARRISGRVEDALLGFGAGVMLAAVAFSLVLPALDAGQALAGSRAAAGAIVAAGIALGGLALLALERAVPHEHFVKGVEGGARGEALKRIWLFVFAIALHNVPEGLAVGVGFGQDETARGVALALGIGIQNVPEGLVVAVALAAAGYSRGLAAVVALATGLVEPLGAFFGAGIVGVSQAVLPWGLAFAAGAMLFVVSHEIIPESHRKGHEAQATMGVLAGFVLMTLLDAALA